MPGAYFQRRQRYLSGESTTLSVSGAGTFAWSNGSNNSSITVSPTVNNTLYTVTVTDPNGYRDSAGIHVTVHSLPSPSISPASVTICSGQPTTLTASGGGSYAWSNGPLTAGNTVSPTVPTTYSVVVTDANNCTAAASRTVNVNAVPIPAINPSPAAVCIGSSTTLTASGGTSYAWNNGDLTAATTVSPAVPTTYSVVVTDANNCTATTSRLVTVNALPTPAISPATAAVCIGSSTTLTASGGTSYAWNNGDLTAATTVSPTVPTTYSVVVTDANNCTATTSRLVSVNPLPIPAISPASAAICNGDNTTLTASGGTSYAWSNGDLTAATTVSPTTLTTYTVVVTDANSCTASTSRSVTVHTLPIPVINPALAAICIGASTTLTASGGTSYAWDNGDNTAATTVSPATLTTYTVVVTDANNCTATTSRSVTVNPLPVPAINPASAAICAGTSTTLTASGGSSYAWDNGDNTAATTVSPSGNTTYNVVVTDANTCTATTSATVTVNPLPIPVVNPASAAICIGNSTTLTASGGTSYAWDNGDNTAATTVSPATLTTYNVVVTDVNNCTATTSATVTVNPLPIPAISPASASICIGTSTTLTASGGTSYAWDNGDNTAATNVSPTTLTTYNVVVTDANTCTATTSATVTVNSPTDTCYQSRI